MSTKVHLVKAMVFPVVMYGCESWTIQIAECTRIDAFELWCWRRLLIVPWIARRSNQSILKGISPGCPLEGSQHVQPTLKGWELFFLALRAQYLHTYFEIPLTWRFPSFTYSIFINVCVPSTVLDAAGNITSEQN